MTNDAGVCCLEMKPMSPWLYAAMFLLGAVPENLLAHASFEASREVLGTSWQFPPAGAALHEADAWRGGQSLALTPSPGGYLAVKQSLAVERMRPGGRYVAFCYVKSSNSSGFVLKFVGTGSNEPWSQAAYCKGTGHWERLRVEFTWPRAGGPTGLLLELLCTPSATDQVLVDAVGLYPLDASWRAAAYPEDWRPGATFAGTSLHDFSHAGYMRGERDVPRAGAGKPIEVVADATGVSDASGDIQAALDAAGEAGGGTVRLAPGTYRCDGPLRVMHSNVVIAGAGRDATRLRFTMPTEGLLAAGETAHITFRGAPQGGGAEFPIDGRSPTAARVGGAAREALRPGARIAIGWVLDEAFVAHHGMQEHWVTALGMWWPFYRREVVEIKTLDDDRVEVSFDTPLPVLPEHGGALSIRPFSGYIEGCGLRDLSISDVGPADAPWVVEKSQAVLFSGVYNSWCVNVHSYAPDEPGSAPFQLQSGGIRVHASRLVTVAGCTMRAPQNRSTGGCGYLFEVAESNEVLVQDCVGVDGRHNFIVDLLFGSSGCVFHRCESSGSRTFNTQEQRPGWRAFSEFHHSLAMACLVDSCTLDDGWFTGNRGDWSEGAGHTATESVFWNNSGGGELRSWQRGRGFVIGTRGLEVATGLGIARDARFWAGTAPEDVVEGEELGGSLRPASLFSDQRRIRGLDERGGPLK